MPNSLTARNFDLTVEVRSYVEKKVDRLRKIFGKACVNVYMIWEGGNLYPV